MKRTLSVIIFYKSILISSIIFYLLYFSSLLQTLATFLIVKIISSSIFNNISVTPSETRLSNFRNFLATTFTTKVAQMVGDFSTQLFKPSFLRQTGEATFWATFKKLVPYQYENIYQKYVYRFLQKSLSCSRCFKTFLEEYCKIQIPPKLKSMDRPF